MSDAASNGRAFERVVPPWLTAGVRGIGAASLLSDIGHEIPTSLLPSLLTATLGSPAVALGVIEGVADGVAGVAQLGGGALADDPQRRRNAAVGGYTATAVLSSLIGIATSVWQVAVFRIGAWTARGLRVPARNALLADIVDPATYGRAYGFERTMDNLGAILGPLFAIALVAVLGIRTAIVVSVIPGLLASLAILYAIRNAPRIQQSERQPIRIKLRPVLRGGRGRLFVGVSAFEFGNVAATLLILRATEQLTPNHGHDRAAEIALVLYAGYNLAAMLTSMPAGNLSDRRGATNILAAGAVSFLVAYAGFAFVSASIPLLLGCFVAAGIGIGCTETVESAAVATLAAESLRGSAFGLLAALQSVGNLAASAVAGALWTLGLTTSGVPLPGSMDDHRRWVVRTRPHRDRPTLNQRISEALNSYRPPARHPCGSYGAGDGVAAVFAEAFAGLAVGDRLHH